MQVCFLTPGLPVAGDDVGELARRLAARDGVSVTLALTEAVPPGADELPFGDARAVAASEAARRWFDIVIATDWTTTAHLFTIPAERHAFRVDHLAHRRMGTWQAERFAAQLAYDLPVDFIAVGEWMAAELRDLRPEARVVVGPRGVGQALHAAAAAAPDDAEAAPGGDATAPARSLRVVVDDRYADDAGSSDDRAAVAEAETTLDVVHLDAADGPADRAAKLAGADVVVMLSPVDGALGAPLEGFHAGATCIVSSAPDAADLVRHGENGIVADPDDVRGTARSLDRLARDRELLGRLRAGARETAAAWPSVDDAAERFATLLEELVAEPPPAQAQWPVRLMGDAIGGAAVFRQEIAALTGEVHRLHGDQAYKTAVAVRERWRTARLGPLRRWAGPVLRRARARLSG